jgi:sensor histidine kinase YesM
MTKLEQAIERAKTLPQEEQDFLAAWLLSYDSDDEVYELSEAEISELERRIASNEKTYTLAEVWDRLKLRSS